VLYVVITRLTYGKEKLAWLQAHHEDLMEKARKVEAQNIDPELEYELQRSRHQLKDNGDQPKQSEG
jgi:HAE1 family hydrophobic/amphiphilic exporter-1